MIGGNTGNIKTLSTGTQPVVAWTGSEFAVFRQISIDMEPDREEHLPHLLFEVSIWHLEGCASI